MFFGHLQQQEQKTDQMAVRSKKPLTQLQDFPFVQALFWSSWFHSNGQGVCKIAYNLILKKITLMASIDLSTVLDLANIGLLLLTRTSQISCSAFILKLYL